MNICKVDYTKCISTYPLYTYYKWICIKRICRKQISERNSVVVGSNPTQANFL